MCLVVLSSFSGAYVFSVNIKGVQIINSDTDICIFISCKHVDLSSIMIALSFKNSLKSLVVVSKLQRAI